MPASDMAACIGLEMGTFWVEFESIYHRMDSAELET
jgi:hypothetical protein